MALGRVLGAEENVDDALGRREVDLSAAERENVGVIVLPAVARQRLVVGRRGEDAGDFVGGHGGADAGAVDHDAELHRAGGDRLGDGAGDFRVVDGGVFALGYEVSDGVVVTAQMLYVWR